MRGRAAADDARDARAALATARTAPAWRSAAARPRIVQKPIPYGPERRADMADYAQRHYGMHDFRLRDPKVVVEHYTATSGFAPVFAYF